MRYASTRERVSAKSAKAKKLTRRLAKLKALSAAGKEVRRIHTASLDCFS
jgi:hypothetical protein